VSFVNLRKLNVRGKSVFLRTDFNVSLKKDRFGVRPVDDFRIKATLPTIKYLRSKNCRIVVGTHLGRPSGRQKDLSIKNILGLVKKNFGGRISFAKDILDPKLRENIKKMKPGEIIVLENLRFWPEEEKAVSTFAKSLALLGQFYINDAFGVVHRAHSSINVLPKYLPSAAGLLLEKELKQLNDVFRRPKRPLVFILGGAKTETKLPLIKRILREAEYLILGGVLANTFFKAQGFDIGESFYDRKAVAKVKSLKFSPSQVFLPRDVLVLTKKNRAVSKPVSDMDPSDAIYDIGPFTLADFNAIIRKSKTVVWNGPIGFYEEKGFDKGTHELAKAVISSDNFSTIGGGDIIAAFNKFGLLSKVSHVSTGGGAMLEFLAGKKLPGLKALGYYN
jgi:phosphoglycerate kinase